MRLTKDEFIHYVNSYDKILEKEHVIIDALGINPEWMPGYWIGFYYDFLSTMCDLPEDKIYGTVLDWFCFDTDFGRKEDMRHISDTDGNILYDITDAGALYDYIIEDIKNENE